MLKKIIFTFPSNTPTAQKFFGHINELLNQLPNAVATDSSIEIRASQPEQALPTTIFRQADVSFPQLLFYNDVQSKADLKELAVGNLRINPVEPNTNPVLGEPLAAKEKQDSLGVYYELQPASLKLFRLPLEELCSRLKGHIVRIDHTGVNLPSELLSRTAWEQLMQRTAQNANIYKYPTGQDWPFILPATTEENETEIKHFPVGREPKFEVVYDTDSPVPTIQIDIETDLTRQEIEHLFPEPYGMSFPDLADFFRAVYVHHEWPGLNIRFDLRFKNDKPDGIWETGKWLVTDGRRYK